MSEQHGEQLQRGLKNRHIQLIALGGAIGTGLFLGIAQTIKMAGPAVLLGYAIGGFIAFLIMRQLGEMVVEEPVAGSFSHFAYKYWGDFAGFASGWNYWVLYVLVAMAELTAARDRAAATRSEHTAVLDAARSHASALLGAAERERALLDREAGSTGRADALELPRQHQVAGRGDLFGQR